MMVGNCPICGQGDCITKAENNTGYIHHYCQKYGFKFYLSDTILNESDTEMKERMFNLIAEHLLHNKVCHVKCYERTWYFYYNDLVTDDTTHRPEYVNVAVLMKNYPAGVMEQAHRALVNLSLLYTHYGDTICIFPTECRFIFEHEINNIQRSGMMRILEDLGYLKDPKGEDVYSITASGWQKIDALRQEEQIVRQGFIAMAFRDETKPIREAFRQAIIAEGYAVAIIDEKEHNNQIVPEIFYEIERSKFVVVDVTYPNYGAYYEAGYAQALGKQVIICCSEDAFRSDNSRPHFDISQKSMIVWKDEPDLARRLRKRIEATVK